jgi:Ricin-type beta-trefoil lectin domain
MTVVKFVRKCSQVVAAGVFMFASMISLSAGAQSAPSYTIELKFNEGWCIDVPGNVGSVGTPVQLWECNKTNAQRFEVIKMPRPDRFRIRHPQSGLCFGNTENKVAPETPMQLVKCNQGYRFSYKNFLRDTDGAVPFLELVGGNEVNETEVCLDLKFHEVKKSGVIQLFTCNYSDAQSWELKFFNTNTTAITPTPVTK